MALQSSSYLGRIDVAGGKSIARIKGFFFDRERVLKAADRAQVRVLSRFGAFVRTTAQRSMRRRKGPSAPGTPPSSHGADKKPRGSKYRGAWLRELLFFSYDPVSKTCVVGPLGFKSSPVPHLHEFGGVLPVKPLTIHYPNGGTKLIPGGVKRYPQRAYMAPALAKEMPKFAKLFEGSIRE